MDENSSAKCLPNHYNKVEYDSLGSLLNRNKTIYYKLNNANDCVELGKYTKNWKTVDDSDQYGPYRMKEVDYSFFTNNGVITYNYEIQNDVSFYYYIPLFPKWKLTGNGGNKKRKTRRKKSNRRKTRRPKK